MGLDSDFSWAISPILLSLKVLIIDAVLFLVFGIYFAYFLAFSKSRFKFIVEFLTTLPLIFPPMATGFLLLYILGKNGILGSFLAKFDISFIFDFKGLVLAGFISGLPLMVKPIESVFKSFNKNIIYAAKICNKNSFEIACFVILPSLKGSIIASLIVSCARAIGEVGISLMLGGNIIGKTDTISLAIYNFVYDGDNEKAMILSLLLIFMTIFLFASMRLISKKAS